MQSDMFSPGGAQIGVSRVRMSTLDMRLCGMVRELGLAGTDLLAIRARLVAIAMREGGSTGHAAIVNFVVNAYQYVIGIASERLGEGLSFPLCHPSRLETMMAQASLRGDAALRRNLALLANALGTLRISAERAA